MPGIAIPDFKVFWLWVICRIGASLSLKNSCVQCILDKYGRFYKDNDMKDMHNVRYRLGPKGNILDYLTVA